jgi:hypothetical protein
MERRSAMKRKIDKEAKRAAVRLGASHVTIIAFFSDGEYLHMQDGGDAPMPADDLYKHMATAVQILDASGGDDVAIT